MNNNNSSNNNNNNITTKSLYSTALDVKECIAVYGNPSHSYGVSLAVWDHTVLPSTQHKRTHPTFTPATQAGTRFTDHLRVEG